MAGLLDIARAAPAYGRLARSQRWPSARLDALVRARLAATLASAARFPFYAQRFAAAGVRGVPRPEDLAALPVLLRRDIPALARAARASARALSTAQPTEIQSSGTTGERIHILVDSQHQSGRFAARLRYLRENGWRPLARTAWLLGLRTGNPDGDLAARGKIFGSRFLSHIDDLEAQLATLDELRPHFLYTLPSALEALVRLLEERGEQLASLQRIFTGGEVLEDGLRARVRARLGCDIADNYGSTEAFLAWQCAAGSYHVNVEHVVVEIVDEAGAAVAPGTLGRVLVTTIENRIMPLLRWDIGDFAEAIAGPCACGRTLPRMGRIHGRVMNLLRRPDGGMLSPWRAIEAVKSLQPVRAVQIVQEALDRYRIRVVSDVPITSADEAMVRDAMCMQVGAPVAVAIDRVAEIARTERGKFLAALCEVEGRTWNEGVNETRRAGEGDREAADVGVGADRSRWNGRVGLAE